MKPLWSQIEQIIDQALIEDIGWGDATTRALIAPNLPGKASILAKENGLLAGIEVAGRVFQRVDPETRFKALVPDGQRIQPGDVSAIVEGNAANILAAERVALNFLQQLSGIASETARYVDATRGLPVRITDTRKTTPGLRILEKYAVRMGGGYNHRLHLGDGILIKDNHLALLRSQGMSLKEIIANARLKASHNLKIEVEVNTPQEALEAAKAGADIIMLDNMNTAEMRQAVQAVKGRALLEASGGINLDNVRAVAATGVDFISVGAITHSAPALDMNLEFQVPAVPRRRRAAAAAPINRPMKLKEPDPPPVPDSELDLHRHSTEEALSRLDQYLYDAYVAGLSSVRVVHGKGTGALRQAIRQQLPGHPLVKSFQPAKSSEGGEGATTIELADW